MGRRSSTNVKKKKQSLHPLNQRGLAQVVVRKDEIATKCRKVERLSGINYFRGLAVFCNPYLARNVAFA